MLDLEASMGYTHRAVLLLPDGHPDRPGYLVNLGAIYNSRYERLQDFFDLETAIELYDLAASLVLDGSSDMRPFILDRLGSAYLSRYQHLGVVVDLDKSILYSKQSVDLTPVSHIEMSGRLNKLGSSYTMRFDRLYQPQDLETAIDIQRKASMITPDNHSQKPFVLKDLARAYCIRYEHLGHLADLDIATELQRQIIRTIPDSHPSKVELLGNLGRSYKQRYSHLGHLEDLEVAIGHTQQAVSLISDRHPNKSVYLGDLSTAYHYRYRCLNAPRDLNLAIEYGRLTISSVTDNHSNRARALGHLGQCLSDRFGHLNESIDMSQSIECFQKAAHSAETDPRVRSSAAQSWATLCVLHQPESALKAYQYFMSLIPRVVWLGLATQQRYNEVSKTAQVTLEAAVVASTIYQDIRALVWLEQGRSIIWSQLQQLRSPLDELRTADSLLAEELWYVANELQTSASLQSHIPYENCNTVSSEHAAQRHRRLVERWEWLVQRAQSLPGTHHFLTPKDPSQLVMAARDRTVVMVLVGRLPCVALIIRPQAKINVEFLQLENLSYDKVVEARNRLARQHDLAIRADRKLFRESVAESEYHLVLSMLWTDVAKPVLDSLEYTKVLPPEDLPHITWCTTGPLSFLPLHAAGDYTQPLCSLSDYCVSSYTPTLSALLASPNDPSTFSGIALVSQASTPGFSPLSGTIKELDTIAKHTKTMHTTRLDGEHATCGSVLTAIEQYSWVHLACHAIQNATNPTKSAFHLHDGPLDLGAISRKQLKRADLAFLSACQTATGDTDLSEEAVHLAAGMIFAGYRTVIATMWPIHDKDAPLVADWFYEYMLRDGLPGRGRAARALHYAVGRLKQQVGIDAYVRWAPFIHMGI
ncbi:hypothetical protein FRC12_011175 [Ceratobasidium sp. 428]|nr:hypothetical protein FRC12_011175 [Ceratobasidium sp. 428]